MLRLGFGFGFGLALMAAQASRHMHGVVTGRAEVAVPDGTFGAHDGGTWRRRSRRRSGIAG